jgi:phytoene dehydrogenase-like protein
MAKTASTYDAVVVGSGPNGLAAAIEIARAKRSVLVLEASNTIGGGCRSAELTLPGFVHDVCSAIHPLALASPFFRSVPLREFGLEWIQPPASVAHPFDDGTAAILERSVDATAETLGIDAKAYRRFVGPLVRNADQLIEDLLAPLRFPHHPLTMALFGLRAIRSARGLAESVFEGPRARAIFAGLAAHSMLPLDRLPTAAFGCMLGMLGHAVGWAIPRGGSQKIMDAVAAYLRSMGGEIRTNSRVSALGNLPPSRATLFDLTPKQLLAIFGDRLPGRYGRALARYRYGPGVFKADYALDGPIPWKAKDCLRAGTVHLGGTLPEIAAAEQAVARGEYADRPFVLVAQQSLFDPARAPSGKQTAWAYCHVPNGSSRDVTDQLEAQIERFAPGFRERVLFRTTRNAVEMEAHNPNYVGGDINGGVQDLGQLFTRPTRSLNPYKLPVAGMYICSSATPPGGGVHGMCGHFAARTALKQL